VRILEGMLNRGIIPLVPIRGSVGASGDLCPLSHLFATLVKRGRFYRIRSDADLQNSHPTLLPVEGSGDDMLSVLREEPELHDLKWEEMAPQPKEGLALNNGAAFSTALLALGVYDARIVVATADVALSMTLEALGGCMRAFDPKVHEARPHRGQKETARRVREILADSELVQCSDEVQDPYSMRCAPQVHGASRDAIEYAATVAECEINSATDNPLIFEGEPWDKHYGRGRDQTTYSAGNFHGQPIALAADFLTIALAELANISERRTQTLMDENHNRLLPGNLIPWAGLNSGFMIAQYTAASLVSENKVLSHPASVDSIPTSSNSEDHVSMSTHAARKMRTVLGNVQAVIAIELLVAAQALEWRVVTKVPSKRAVTADEKQTVREKWRPDSDEGLARQATVFKDAVADGDEAAYKRKHDHIAAQLASGLRSTYSAIREHAPPMVEDRALDEDVRKVRKLIGTGALSGPTAVV
jgi:histidine ammonia-lyase